MVSGRKVRGHSATRGGQPFNLFRRDADAAKPELRLTQSTNMQTLVDWSGHGKWLPYSEVDSKTGPDLWMVSASGNGPTVPLLQTSHAEIEGRFCPIPDSGAIAYTSNDSGRSEVYAGAFDPAAPEKGLRGRWQVSTNHGFAPRWRRDGRELFYLSPDGNLM